MEFSETNDRKEKGKQRAQTGSLISLWKSKQRRDEGEMVMKGGEKLLEERR